MKKIITVLVTATLLFSTVACSQQSDTPSGPAQTVTVQSLNGTETVDVEVPRDPGRVAVLDMAALDILDSWGFGSRVVGVPKATRVDYLAQYSDDDEIKNLGSLKDVDMEALMSSRPDVIFIGPRLVAEYEKLSQIAPVVVLTVDYKVGYVQSFKDNLTKVARIFGIDKDDGKRLGKEFSSLGQRIGKLKQEVAGKTAVMGMVTSSNFNTLGNNSAGSIIFNEIGMNNLASRVDSTHGDAASFELLVDLNPDYIFVLDRDSAIGAQGTQAAEQVMDNELVKKTDAYKNQNIVYLSPAVWYLAVGGITATDTMLVDLEQALAG